MKVVEPVVSTGSRSSYVLLGGMEEKGLIFFRLQQSAICKNVWKMAAKMNFRTR